jgi:flagellar hook-basal body complex protein FliE
MEIKFPEIDTEKIFQEKVNEIQSRTPDKIEGKKEPDKSETESFFSSLANAIKNVREAQKEAREKSMKMILGEVEDIHDVMISREKANTLFQLFLEVRNRAVQAFENIMRMQF